LSSKIRAILRYIGAVALQRSAIITRIWGEKASFGGERGSKVIIPSDPSK
jgi:hypothetical protein